MTTPKTSPVKDLNKNQAFTEKSLIWKKRLAVLFALTLCSFFGLNALAQFNSSSTRATENLDSINRGGMNTSEEQISFGQFVNELESQLQKSKTQKAPIENPRRFQLSLASSLVQYDQIDPTLLTGFSLGYGKLLEQSGLASEFGIKYFAPNSQDNSGMRIKKSHELYAQMHIVRGQSALKGFFLVGFGLRELSATNKKGFQVDKFSPSLALGAGMIRQLGEASNLKLSASTHPFFEEMALSQSPFDFTIGLETLF